MRSGRSGRGRLGDGSACLQMRVCRVMQAGFMQPTRLPTVPPQHPCHTALHHQDGRLLAYHRIGHVVPSQRVSCLRLAGCACRYAATTEEMGNTLMQSDLPRRSPIPDFAEAAAAAGSAAAGGTAGGAAAAAGAGAVLAATAAAAARPASPSKGAAGHAGHAGHASAWRRLLSRHSKDPSSGAGSGDEGAEEPAWRRSWRERQAAAEEAPPHERFTVLFPEVVE